MKKLLHVVLLMMLVVWVAPLRGQTANPVVPTGKTQTVNGVKYYIQVVEKDQTIFSIARAYGLHYSAAVIKSDIHELTVGDTVWLPCNDQSRAAVSRVIGKAEVVPEYQEMVVEPKQTPYGISKLYGITLDAFYELNPEVKENGLKAGQTVKLPAGAKAKTTATTQNGDAAKTSGTAAKGTTSTTSGSVTSATAAKTTNTGQYHADVQKNGGGQPAKKSEPAKTSTPEKPAAPVTATIRERVNKEKVVVSVMMPLYLNRMSEISTTKFDVDQRGKKDYKSFEFIQFYEGILMAMDELESSGVKVQLNVVDVTSEMEADVTKAYESHDVAQSDLLIALLQKNGFEVVSKLAMRDHLFVVSPMSQRAEILKGNPYAVKYMPSETGMVNTMLDNVVAENPGSPVFLVYANGKETSELKNELERQLKSRSITYTLCDWNTSSEKLATKLKAAKHPVVISTYDQGRDRNRLFANKLLNGMMAAKSNQPVLYTFNNLLRDIPDVDYGQLQLVNYHLFYPAYLDYENLTHKGFVDAYKARYKTEPMNGYAAVGHDIMLYFATGIGKKGADFWRSPSIPKVEHMLFPIHMSGVAGGGIENQAAVMYKLVELHLQQAGGKK